MSSERGSLSIDPTKKDEYLAVVEQSFDIWHKKEWFFLSDEEFKKTSRASFLAYVKYLVENSDSQGHINLEKAEQGLKDEMGEYFREQKLENALWFIRAGDWKDLLVNN